MKKADLHIHTASGNGVYSLDYLLETYKEKGYDTIAITDKNSISDCISNNKVVKEKEEKYKMKIIIGMESTVDFDGNKVDLLCYFNSCEDITQKLNLYMNHRKDFIKSLNEKVKEKANEDGIIIPDVDFSLIDSTSFMPILMEVSKRSGKTTDEAHKFILKCIKELSLNSNSSISIEELIKEVHKSKGLVFVANPLNHPKETVKKIIDLGVDGIEAIYPDYNKEEIKYLINFAENYNILYIAGSDLKYKNTEDIGSVELKGKPLNKFIAKLTGENLKETLQDKVARWLRETDVILEPNVLGEQYFATYKNKTNIINLADFNMNGPLLKINNSKLESMTILDKFNIPHIEIHDLSLDENEAYQKALDFFVKNNNRCVIRADKRGIKDSTFTIFNVADIKPAIESIISMNLRPVISPYYYAKYEYRACTLNGKTELVITKEQTVDGLGHALSKESKATVISNCLIKENLDKLCNDVSNIFGINFGAIDVLDTSEGLKVVGFGLPNVSQFAGLSEENEKVSKGLFIKAFLNKFGIK